MKKLIPPFLFVICLVLMLIIHYSFPIREFISKPYNYIGIIPVLLGFVMTGSVRRQFEKLNTEIHTFKAPRKLTTTGLFKISRNPIYLGFTVSLAGFWILLGTVLPVAGVALFIIITNSWYIPFEEKNMEKQFGNEYLEYKSKVRRWL